MIIRKPVHELVPEGIHRATIIWVVDIGWQRSQFDNSLKRKLLITWEFADQKLADGRPMVLTSRPLTASLDDRANLVKMLKKLKVEVTDEFDPKVLVGRPCQVAVSHLMSGHFL